MTKNEEHCKMEFRSLKFKATKKTSPWCIQMLSPHYGVSGPPMHCFNKYLHVGVIFLIMKKQKTNFVNRWINPLSRYVSNKETERPVWIAWWEQNPTSPSKSQPFFGNKLLLLKGWKRDTLLFHFKFRINWSGLRINCGLINGVFKPLHKWQSYSCSLRVKVSQLAQSIIYTKITQLSDFSMNI